MTGERERLLHMEEEISKAVIGQDEVLFLFVAIIIVDCADSYFHRYLILRLFVPSVTHFVCPALVFIHMNVPLVFTSSQLTSFVNLEVLSCSLGLLV